MIDSIEPVSGVTESQPPAQAAFMQQMEMADVHNTNLIQQVNENYKNIEKSLAQSTGDSAISGQVN